MSRKLKTPPGEKLKQKPTIAIYKNWCKRCGICVAFCPTSVLTQDDTGYPVIKDPEACIGCGLCEIRCPDFAIEIKFEEPDLGESRK